MKLISWNVNGIRAVLDKGLFQPVLQENPDILCLQETKATAEQVSLEIPGYQAYWNSAVKKGYSGTAVFSKIQPLGVRNGMGIDKHDQEGRLQTLEFDDFFLVNVYTPNAQRDLARLSYRTQEWEADFLHYLKDLDAKKPVLFCGDLNVAHKEIDLANPKTNRRNAGFTDEERACFDRIVENGFVDTFREFCTEGGHYTWWSYMFNARAKNVGWRIDYFCISSSLRPRLKNAAILCDIKGSDHCPIQVEIE